jgi:hypothetical protein
MKLPRVREGEPITADLFNRLFEVAEKCGLGVAQGSGLSLIDGPDGYVLGASVPVFRWGKTTGALSGGTYPITEQFPAASGTWTAGSLSVTAYEDNGNTSVATNTYVKFWRSVQGDWRFSAGTC